MNRLAVELDGPRYVFEPGDEVAGKVSWELDAPPESIELRLFWYTEGKGTQDVEIVDTVAYAAPRAEDDEAFRLRLPAGPLSFSGKLISLVWALELVALPSGDTARAELLVSHLGHEIRIDGEG